MGKRNTGKILPLVSVIMPVYNAQKYVEQAIRSVINQTMTEWELLVFDDCSTDDTGAIVEYLSMQDDRITLIRNGANIGVAQTRNRGLERFRGSFVAFLDSDDVWYPEKLEKQISRMRETGADLGYSSYSIINAENQKAHMDYLVPEQVFYEDLLKENMIGCSTVILSSAIAKKYRFKSEFYHEDYVLWLQILKDGYIASGCSEVLADWRHVEKSRSFNKWKSAKNRWNIYRRFLKLPFGESVSLTCSYALAGLRKYRKSA